MVLEAAFNYVFTLFTVYYTAKNILADHIKFALYFLFMIHRNNEFLSEMLHIKISLCKYGTFM